VESFTFIQIIGQGHCGVKRETVGINSFWTQNSHMSYDSQHISSGPP